MRREDVRGLFTLALLIYVAAIGAWLDRGPSAPPTPDMSDGWAAAEWNALASWLTLLVLVGTAVFAAREVRETVRLREAQTRPFVVVDFDVESVFIHLTVENTGPLAARDVTLEFEPPLISTVQDPWPDERSTFLSQGIPTLAPGKKYRFFLDSFPPGSKSSFPCPTRLG